MDTCVDLWGVINQREYYAPLDSTPSANSNTGAILVPATSYTSPSYFISSPFDSF